MQFFNCLSMLGIFVEHNGIVYITEMRALHVGCLHALKGKCILLRYFLYQPVLGDACGLMIHQETFLLALEVSQSLLFLVS